ncbi:MAG: SDR family NAD(P)-dependent oxidoreductase, partial [Cyanobium sp.]
LVAVDLACRSLRDRSTDLALAGGVSLLLTPVNSLCFARSGMMAADGHCKTFDAAADGYVRGEGCGVVVLKRLADAVAAGDPILAVLRGSGVNQDGASAGLTVPNGEAQAALIRRTLELAQLDGDQIDVLEAHGTGTPLGDPIELKALAPIYGRRERDQPLRLGSVKTNLGHLEGAAGVAGLIKAVLMVQHGRIPPHLHLRQRTPYLNWNDWSLQIPTATEAWAAAGGAAETRPRWAAVSSFGFSGTNAHVLVEQAPAELRPAAAPPATALLATDWLLLSAGSEAALRQLAQELAAWLPQQPGSAWPAICATSRTSRSRLPWRLAVSAADAREAVERLSQPALALRQGPPQPPSLAFRLTAASSAGHWSLWQSFGLRATALVHGPAQRDLAHRLAGSPPQLRLIADDAQAPSALEAHGYGPALELAAPDPAALVALWLAGHTIDWAPLAPAGLWPRQVLPTTPFDPVRCWIEEQPAEEADPGQPLQHERRWQPVPPPAAPLPVAGAAAPTYVLLGGTAALRASLAAALPLEPAADPVALEALLQEPQRQNPQEPSAAAPPVLLLAPPADLQDLSEPFWQELLPLLHGLIARAPRLGPVHWLLQHPETPAGEAWAALARSWAWELGPQAGGLLWCGPAGEGLPRLLAHGPGPSGGQEWRLDGSGRVEQAGLEPLGPLPACGPPVLPPTATTLISGGLGALGLATAEALRGWGARHLTLVSRRPPDAAQQQRLAALRQAGVELTLEQLDVADAGQVAALFERLAAAGRPLAGIIHAAGVLDDGLLVNQSPARCAAVAAAKVRGGLLLEQGSRAIPHGFFVVYSSLAAALGSPGQAPYAAANGFLDGLMLQRRAAGLPGLAINWGPWAGAGMAARHQGGLEPLQPAQALALLERWLPRQGRVVLAQLRPAATVHPLAPRLQALAAELPALAADAEQARRAVERCLADLLVELGGFAGEELAADTRLDALGLDSLMAVELATAVQAGLGVSLGLGALAGEPTLASLAAHLLALLQAPAGEPESAGAGLDLGAEARLPEDLQQALQGCRPEPPRAEPEAILLTGATGFLGAFLLAYQLERHPRLSVYCLVRAEGAGAARARVRANLEHYGLWQDGWAARIVALPGDLALPGLGLDASAWQGLVERLDGVLHNGAQLSYVAPYGQLRAANVGGTLEVLRLAAAASAPLEFISSTAVY